MYVWEIRPQCGAWRLSPQGAPEGLSFATYLLAEARARWLAIRQEVKGFPTEIRVLDPDDRLVGVWRGERYEAASCAALAQAA